MHIYKTFIDTVARGRSLPEKTVAELAGCKVYSGEQVLNLKLVDALGSLDEAAKYAAELANIKEQYSVKEIKKPLPLTEAFPDIETINIELALADLASLDKRAERAERGTRQ